MARSPYNPVPHRVAGVTLTLRPTSLIRKRSRCAELLGVHEKVKRNRADVPGQQFLDTVDGVIGESSVSINICKFNFCRFDFVANAPIRPRR
jgi:hypothetical protein